MCLSFDGGGERVFVVCSGVGDDTDWTIVDILIGLVLSLLLLLPLVDTIIIGRIERWIIIIIVVCTMTI